MIKDRKSAKLSQLKHEKIRMKRNFIRCLWRVAVFSQCKPFNLTYCKYSSFSYFILSNLYKERDREFEKLEIKNTRHFKNFSHAVMHTCMLCCTHLRVSQIVYCFWCNTTANTRYKARWKIKNDTIQKLRCHCKLIQSVDVVVVVFHHRESNSLAFTGARRALDGIASFFWCSILIVHFFPVQFACLK